MGAGVIGHGAMGISPGGHVTDGVGWCTKTRRIALRRQGRGARKGRREGQPNDALQPMLGGLTDGDAD